MNIKKLKVKDTFKETSGGHMLIKMYDLSEYPYRRILYL